MSYTEVTPASFGLEAPPPRPIGHETEYDILLPDGKRAKGWQQYLTQPQVLQKAELQIYGTNTGVWLSNGAYVYQDLDHLEYCTPESLGPREATATAHAGNLILNTLIEASPRRYLLFRRSATVDPLTGRCVTKGFHQNFCVPLEIANNETLQLLEPHLTTSLYAWGGIVTLDGFNISPKSLGIGRGVSDGLGARTGAGEKAMGTIRSSSNGDSDTLDPRHGFARLEDRTKTPSSPWSDFMAAATTSLLLRILEHPQMFDKEKRTMDSLRLAHTVRTFREVARDMTFRKTYELQNGKRYTAIDIQECLATLAISARQRLDLPEDEVYATEQWTDVDQDLRDIANGRADLSLVSDRIGWAAKYTRLRRKFQSERPLHEGTPAALAACLLWDRVVPEGAGQKHAALYGRSIFDAATMQHYALNPPQETRARVRAAYIADHNTEDGYKITRMRWPLVNLWRRSKGAKERYALLHPFQTEQMDFMTLPAVGTKPAAS